jgi:hypothetical protein
VSWRDLVLQPNIVYHGRLELRNGFLLDRNHAGFVHDSKFRRVGFNFMSNPGAVRYRRLALAESDKEKAQLLQQIADEAGRGDEARRGFFRAVR